MLAYIDAQLVLERLIALTSSVATAAAGATAAARLCRASPALCGVAVSLQGVSAALKVLHLTGCFDG